MLFTVRTALAAPSLPQRCILHLFSSGFSQAGCGCEASQVDSSVQRAAAELSLQKLLSHVLLSHCCGEVDLQLLDIKFFKIPEIWVILCHFSS